MKILEAAWAVGITILAAIAWQPHAAAAQDWKPAMLPVAEHWAVLCTEDWRRAHNVVLKDMSKIHWRQARRGTLAWGAIAFTDTITNAIFVSVEWQDTVWVLSHELVHYLISRPAIDSASQDGVHPFNPFAFPCQVLPFQHVPGGILGKRLSADAL